MTRPASETQPEDDDYRPESTRLTRGLWGVVAVLAAALLLAVVAIASTAILSPDAFVDSCHRPQLLTPLGCGPPLPTPEPKS